MRLLLLCLSPKLVNSEAAVCKPWLLQGRKVADSYVELRPASFPAAFSSSISSQSDFFQSKAILQREQPCLALQDDQQNNRTGSVSLCDWESIGMSWQIVQDEFCSRTSPANLRGAGSQGHLGSGAHSVAPCWTAEVHLSPFSSEASFVTRLNGNVLENEKEQNRLFGFADNPAV